MEQTELEKAPEQKEAKEKFSSQIRLRFFRHSEKEAKKEGQTDEEIRLTPGGRKLSAQKADIEDIGQAVAFGSPRKRAQETAGLVMAGKLDEITGEESLEELKAIVDNDLKVGSKIATDKRLDFILDAKSEYGKKAHEAFGQKRMLKFLVEESDQLAKELGVEDQTTYSGSASAIAQIIEKYIKIAPRWDELVKDEKKGYDKNLERFFGSHLSVPDSFLAKLIEKTKGIEERNKFVQALDNHGSDYAEGFGVNIINIKNKKPIINIDYKKEKEGQNVYEFNEEIPVEMIEEIAHPKEEK